MATTENTPENNVLLDQLRLELQAQNQLTADLIDVQRQLLQEQQLANKIAYLHAREAEPDGPVSTYIRARLDKEIQAELGLD